MGAFHTLNTNLTNLDTKLNLVGTIYTFGMIGGSIAAYGAISNTLTFPPGTYIFDVGMPTTRCFITPSNTFFSVQNGAKVFVLSATTSMTVHTESAITYTVDGRFHWCTATRIK